MRFLSDSVTLFQLLVVIQKEHKCFLETILVLHFILFDIFLERQENGLASSNLK